MKNEARPIDANALAQKIKEYMEDFPNAETRLAACRAVLSMLGDEGQTPTLTDHFREVTKMVPLTMAQLREMDGKPVYVVCASNKSFWALVAGRFVECIKGGYYWKSDMNTYGKSWLAYTYPPAHIDREAWTAEWIYPGNEWNLPKCSKCGCNSKDAQYGHKNNFCPKCGRAMTPEAWAEVEKRMGVRA